MKIRFFTFFIMFLVVVTVAMLAIAPVVRAAPELGRGHGSAILAPVADDQAPAIPEAVYLLIPLLVGRIGVPVINFLKEKFGWVTEADKRKNLWLAFGVSLALAVLALAITSAFTPLIGPESLVTWIGMVFTVATLVYKSMQPSITPATPVQ